MVVKINWLMLLNSSTLHTSLSTESSDRTQHLFNYNVCKHQNVSGICMRNINMSDALHIITRRGKNDYYNCLGRHSAYVAQ